MRRMPGRGSVYVRSYYILFSIPVSLRICPSLAGLHMWPTAHLIYLLRSEFTLEVENLLPLTL
jgi:hypothetical protein